MQEWKIRSIKMKIKVQHQKINKCVLDFRSGLLYCHGCCDRNRRDSCCMACRICFCFCCRCCRCCCCSWIWLPFLAACGFWSSPWMSYGYSPTRTFPSYPLNAMKNRKNRWIRCWIELTSPLMTLIWENYQHMLDCSCFGCFLRPTRAIAPAILQRTGWSRRPSWTRGPWAPCRLLWFAWTCMNFRRFRQLTCFCFYRDDRTLPVFCRIFWFAPPRSLSRCSRFGSSPAFRFWHQVFWETGFPFSKFEYYQGLILWAFHSRE